jgi:hypothetical protein
MSSSWTDVDVRNWRVIALLGGAIMRVRKAVLRHRTAVGCLALLPMCGPRSLEEMTGES